MIIQKFPHAMNNFSKGSPKGPRVLLMQFLSILKDRKKMIFYEKCVFGLVEVLHWMSYSPWNFWKRFMTATAHFRGPKRVNFLISGTLYTVPGDPRGTLFLLKNVYFKMIFRKNVPNMAILNNHHDFFRKKVFFNHFWTFFRSRAITIASGAFLLMDYK